jgi:pyruvate/2-oxoglutarate dehydrogenase complex dihydrolipoamide dehydrogenase (E3) component
MDEPYDFVILGGGSAGYAAAAMAVRCGMKTAVIEGGDEVGGLCILRGCMPSKTLLESGHRAHAIRHAGEYGLRASYSGPDAAAILARKRRLIGEFADYRREQLERGRFDFIRGMASFRDPHTVAVRQASGGEERLIAGRAFLIATGSQLNWVGVPGLSETGCLTSDDVLDSERIPASVVVLGGGSIALEFASYYAGIGSSVTVIQRGPQVLKEVDADVAAALTAGLERRGIRILCDTALTRVEKTGNGKRVRFFHSGEEKAVEAEEIIYALGRRPNADGLSLDLAGVEADRGGIKAAATQQTSVPHIFAAGDVCGPYEVVHIAIQQAEIAARNAARVLGRFGGQEGAVSEPLERMDYALKLFAVFTHPELAAVGLTEREAAEQGIPFIEAKYPFNDHGKSLVRGETDGFVKLIAERDSRRIVGGAVIGPEAAELIHEIVVAMRFGATAGQLAQVPHYHPTLSEIWTYPAEALAEA